jgi:hypothetical protein
MALTGCGAVAGPVVTSTDFKGDIPGLKTTAAGILYQDGAQSIAVPGGSLWVFGDSFRGHTNPSTKPTITDSISNTIALLPEGNTHFPPELQYLTGPDGIATAPLSFFDNEDPKRLRMWPAGGVAVNGRVYLFYSMIEVGDAPGPWNFHGIGSGLAVAPKPLSKFVRLTPDGSWKFPLDAICVLTSDRFLYFYQVSDHAGAKGLIIARCDPARIEDPAAYRFFNGQDWLSDVASAKVILTEAYGQVSVAWNPALKQFLLVTSSDFFHPQEMQFRTGPNPWGPWSEPTRIAVPPKPGKKTNLIYCSFMHPELSSADGSQITLTFCRILDGTWQLSNPEMVRVTIAPASAKR